MKWLILWNKINSSSKLIISHAKEKQNSPDICGNDAVRFIGSSNILFRQNWTYSFSNGPIAVYFITGNVHGLWHSYRCVSISQQTQLIRLTHSIVIGLIFLFLSNTRSFKENINFYGDKKPRSLDLFLRTR